MVSLIAAIREFAPVALLYRQQPGELLASLIANDTRTTHLPLHDYRDVTILEAPLMPTEEDFTDEDSDGEPELDEIGFNVALLEYEMELQEYASHQDSGEFNIALLITDNKISPVLFNPAKPAHKNLVNPQVTAKK